MEFEALLQWTVTTCANGSTSPEWPIIRADNRLQPAILEFSTLIFPPRQTRAFGRKSAKSSGFDAR